MGRRPRVHLAPVAALLWLAGLGAAQACGSMGLDDPRALAKLSAAVFGPMVALIPLELWFLHRLGGLHDRFIRAYLACLPAKLAGLLLVSGGVAAGLVQHVVTAELAYSAGHLAVAALVLGAGFKLAGKPLWTCAIAISTVIPWTYSLALYLINHAG